MEEMWKSLQFVAKSKWNKVWIFLSTNSFQTDWSIVKCDFGSQFILQSKLCRKLVPNTIRYFLLHQLHDCMYKMHSFSREFMLYLQMISSKKQQTKSKVFKQTIPLLHNVILASLCLIWPNWCNSEKTLSGVGGGLDANPHPKSSVLVCSTYTSWMWV